ncbi:MAG: hypothetical protein EBU33_03310 [Sphingobacteriia bacterium]|nr:hypothetical protein [Sphingobacteriia bacterium]
MSQQQGLFVCDSVVKRFTYSSVDEIETIFFETLGGAVDFVFLQSQKISLWMQCNPVDGAPAKFNSTATRIWTDEQCWLGTPHLCENIFGNAIFLGNVDCVGSVYGLSDYEIDFLESFV